MLILLTCNLWWLLKALFVYSTWIRLSNVYTVLLTRLNLQGKVARRAIVLEIGKESGLSDTKRFCFQILSKLTTTSKQKSQPRIVWLFEFGCNLLKTRIVHNSGFRFLTTRTSFLEFAPEICVQNKSKLQLYRNLSTSTRTDRHGHDSHIII